MKMKIIVPTDFSRASANAYRYARNLAEEYQTTIEVVHVYSGTFATGEVPTLIPLQGITEGLEHRLKKFTNLYPNQEEGEVKTALEIKTELLMGTAVNVITRKSEEEDVFMIVMGATGEHDAIDRLFGSVSSHVAQKAACPVLLVPQHAVYQPYEKIMYASNFESADDDSLEKLKNLAEFFGAAIHFVHVSEGEDEKAFIEVRSRIIDRLFKDYAPGFSFSIKSIHTDSVLNGLYDYANEHHANLMVLVNRQRGFWDSLLGHSLTKKAALHPELPVLVDHLD